MSEITPLQGELQLQIMAALWRIQSATVEQVREALPVRYRGAYTTVQTVLNRLSDRGLVGRERRGNVIVYAPSLTEAQYLSQSIESTLAGASADARQVALASLVGGLEASELSDLRRLAQDVARRRDQGQR